MTKTNIFEWVESVGQELHFKLGGTDIKYIFKNLKDLKYEFEFDSFDVNKSDEFICLRFDIYGNRINVYCYYKLVDGFISKVFSDGAVITL